MRFLVVGAGAIGSAFGGFLRKAGEEVCLAGRPEGIAAILEKGLLITGIWGEHRVSSFHNLNMAHHSETFDAILICVKSYDTAAAARRVRGLIGDQTLVISLQNGLGNMETIRKNIHHSSVLGGRVIFGAQVPAPGEVKITVYTQPVMIGFPDMARRHYPKALMDKAAAVAAIISRAGIPCEFTEEIEKYLWAKLLYNCALNPLGAIHGVCYGKLAEKQEWRDTMDAVVREIFEVAKAKGVSLSWQRPEEFLEVFYSKLVPDTYHHRSSMLQDIEKGKKTEIESMNGMVVKYGVETGVAVPVNENLIRLLEAKYNG